jgi:hypothetical protein
MATLERVIRHKGFKIEVIKDQTPGYPSHHYDVIVSRVFSFGCYDPPYLEAAIEAAKAFIEQRKVIDRFRYRGEQIYIVQNPEPYDDKLSICIGRYPKDDDGGLIDATLESTREFAASLVDKIKERTRPKAREI